MTVRTTAMQTCDRCLKPFNEKHLKAGDEVPTFKQKGLVVTATIGTNKEPEPEFKVLLSFDDMCPDCQKAVENLIGKIQLDGKKPSGRKPRKKRQKKAKEPEKPQVPEYSEGEEEAEAKPPEEPAPEPASEDKDAPPPKEAKPAEAKPEEETPAEASSGDNGSGATTNTEGLVEDPETGDMYDPNTGEVVVRGDGKAKAAAAPPTETKSDDNDSKGDHPF